jgi:hypothetical protein
VLCQVGQDFGDSGDKRPRMVALSWRCTCELAVVTSQCNRLQITLATANCAGSGRESAFFKIESWR